MYFPVLDFGLVPIALGPYYYYYYCCLVSRKQHSLVEFTNHLKEIYQ